MNHIKQRLTIFIDGVIKSPENDVVLFERNVKKLGVEVKSKPIEIFQAGKRKDD